MESFCGKRHSTALLHEMIDIIEAKVEILAKAGDAAGIEFLSVIASHDGGCLGRGRTSVLIAKAEGGEGTETFTTSKLRERSSILSSVLSYISGDQKETNALALTVH